MANIGDYATTYAQFDWETPGRFNFGRDVVDKWAQEHRPAMIWLGAGGEERRLGFEYFSQLSNRFANVCSTLGVGSGDRVMVLLDKSPSGTRSSRASSSSAPSPSPVLPSSARAT